jgi:hypothetical protein
VVPPATVVMGVKPVRAGSGGEGDSYAAPAEAGTVTAGLLVTEA